MNGIFNGMFNKVASGMCRISMDGEIAVKTSTGYKTYNVNTGSLVNCDNFAFDIGEDFFFVIPTNRVQKGDIILVSGKPCCVIAKMTNTLKVLRYEDGAIQEIAIEKHFFMGKQYFYGKIVSMFGSNFKKGGMGNIMKYMALSQMMKGNKGLYMGGSNMDMSSMLPFLFMKDEFSNVFDGMFEDEDEDEETTTAEVEEEK